MDLIDIFKTIEKKENFQCGNSQNEDQIQLLEKHLHMRFPNSYKQFLKNYGYATWDEGDIYGLSNDPDFDLLEKNRFARDRKLPKDFLLLPEDAFIIDKYPGGGYYMLFSADSPRAGEVGLFLSETGYHEEETWESFEAFLEDYYCS